MNFLILLAIFLFLSLGCIESIRLFNPILPENIDKKLKLVATILLIAMLITIFISSNFHVIN